MRKETTINDNFTEQASFQDDKTDSDESYPPRAYSWYVVVLMMCFYVLSFMDRQIIAVMIEPIKADLLLSDVQVSLLGGLSFVLFYAVAGIFVGRLADSVNRPLLIAGGVFLWSLTTACCGFAGKFWHLLMLRMGVGLGESVLMPSTLSLITDYFPAKRLATPTSVFMLGAPIGIGLSFAGGGYLYGVAETITGAPGWSDFPMIGGVVAWKLVLLFLGVLGMLMTFLLFTVSEPRDKKNRIKVATDNVKRTRAASFSEIKTYFMSHWKAIGGLYVGMSFISVASYSQAFWDISFLTRTYGWDATTGSFWYGAVQLTAGLSGMCCGGYFSDKLSRKGIQGASVIMVLVGIGIAIPFSFVYPLVGSANLSLCLMLFVVFGSNMAFACTAASIQRLFPSTMLGLAAGIYFFISNAVGLGMGPTAVAALTEYVFDNAEMIRYSLTSVGGLARVLAFVIVFIGFKYYKQLVSDLDRKSTKII
jgi:MFS family permease